MCLTVESDMPPILTLQVPVTWYIMFISGLSLLSMIILPSEMLLPASFNEIGEQVCFDRINNVSAVVAVANCP